tara:strand:+ start:515 stop:1066 length:552 start_codon:yes stop_codon:yes gene_type:complete
MLERDEMIGTLRERYDLMDLPSDRVMDTWDEEYSMDIVNSLLHHVINTRETIHNPYGFIKAAIVNWRIDDHQPKKRKRKKKREMPSFMKAAIENIKAKGEPYVVMNDRTGDVKVPELTEDIIQWAWKTDRSKLTPEAHMKFFWVMVGCNAAAGLKYKPSFILISGIGTSLMYENLDFDGEELP